MPSPPQATPAVVVERRYRSPPEQVWIAWTHPRELEAWFYPLDSRGVRVAAFDLRVGGAYRIEFGPGPNNAKNHAVGVFREVAPPRRLAFSWEWVGDPPMPDSLVTVEFEPEGDGTKLRLTHAGLPAGEPAETHRQGWSWILDRLAAREARQ